MARTPPAVPSGAGNAVTPARPRRRWRIVLALLALVLLPIVLFTVYVWIALHWSYSEGERAGYVQKFSRKGWVCKTWEGELAMATIPGAMPEIFRFTVRDQAVAARINQSMGQRVAVSYEQHPGLPTSCFGETEYFATGVRTVGP